MSVDGLRCILYARIYIPYMRNILYHYIQTGTRPAPISSELVKNKLLIGPVFIQPTLEGINRISLHHKLFQTLTTR